MSGHDDHDALPPADPRIAEAARSGCAESRLLMSRRSMLGVTAALFTSAFLPDFAKADTDPEARLFIVVLRGGMDGIGMLVPKLDPVYESARRQLALPFAQTLSLGTDFALHPGLSRLHGMFNAGEAAFVPAAGIPLKNRSHFECQDNLENGCQSTRQTQLAGSTGSSDRCLQATRSASRVASRSAKRRSFCAGQNRCSAGLPPGSKRRLPETSSAWRQSTPRSTPRCGIRCRSALRRPSGTCLRCWQ